MTDPFDALRDPAPPVAPDPQFAATLRARLERALARPRGVTPVTATLSTPTAPDTDTERPAALPYLAVTDARAAIAWYVDVFDARVEGDPIEMPDGRIGHVELRIGDGVLYLADEHREIGVAAPREGEASVSLMLPVRDADAVRARAVNHGADGRRPPYGGYGQRHAWIVDPFGHRWGLHSPLPLPDAPPAYRSGDVVHLALIAPDVERTRAFYAAVLGWTYGTDGRVAGSTPSVGFRVGAPRVTCDYAVGDLDVAVDAVRDAGGEPGGIERHPWGTVAECADDQGTPFRLHEVDTSARGARPPANGTRAGDVGYLTLEVRDSARARAFYGAVLGWTFAPGHVEDGWSVSDPVPMSGMAGGRDSASAVPLWLVADIDAGVAAVRARGGTATDPEQQPYGPTSTCTDDQGVRFYLGQA